jgi:hypothetical protein
MLKMLTVYMYPYVELCFNIIKNKERIQVICILRSYIKCCFVLEKGEGLCVLCALSVELQKYNCTKTVMGISYIAGFLTVV